MTIDNSSNVANVGTIEVTEDDDATRILAQGNLQTTITITGEIIVDESYAPTDFDKHGDRDGSFSQGIGRKGAAVSP